MVCCRVRSWRDGSQGWEEANGTVGEQEDAGVTGGVCFFRYLEVSEKNLLIF